MIESTLAFTGRYTFTYNAVMFLMLGVLWGFVVGDHDDVAPLVVVLLVWFVVLIGVAVGGSVLMRRWNNRLIAYVGAASPAIANDASAPLVPAQVVRHRLARSSGGYVAGFAGQHPPAFSVFLRVLAAEGPRLAVALVPPRAGGYPARSYLGVRVDADHPDVAVLDLAAVPATMGERYAAGLAAPGARKPSVGWGSTALWGVAGMVAGLVVGFVVGLVI